MKTIKVGDTFLFGHDLYEKDEKCVVVEVLSHSVAVRVLDRTKNQTLFWVDRKQIVPVNSHWEGIYY